MTTGIFPFTRFLREYDVWEFDPMDHGGQLVRGLIETFKTDVEQKLTKRPGP